MPSTTNTTLTVASIFDLIGVGTPAGPTAADSSGFDSLLQQPPQSPSLSDPPPQNPSSHIDQDQRAPAAAESAPADVHSPSDESRSDDSHNESTPQSASKNPPPTATPPPTTATPPSNSKPQQEAQQIDAQSLAGLAAVNASIKPTPPKPDSATAEETPADPKPVANIGLVTPGNRTIAIANAPANPQNAGAVSPSASKVTAEKEASNAAGGQAISVTDKQHAAAATAAAVAAATNQTTGDKAPAVDPLLAAQAEHGAKTAEASDANAAGSKDQHRDNAHTVSDTATLDLQAALAASTSDAAATGQASVTPPAIAPLTVQTPLADSAPLRPNSQPASQSQAIAPPGQRSRLPADVLAPSAQTTNRRPSIEIDTARLLTRVARAVTTAQERDGEVHLRLSPPELGSLRLDVKVQDGALVAHLQTETDAARTAILDNLPALRDRLADQGVRIERFDVDLMQRQPGGMADQPGGRQQEPLPPEARVVLPPRPTTNPVSPSSLPSVPRPSTSAGGLNVIV